MSQKSLFEKVTLSTRPSRLNPKALALLDVLIGMAIFALIAVIAVIAMGRFKGQAFVTRVQSDSASLSESIEGGVTTTDGIYPTGLGDGTGNTLSVDDTTGEVTWNGKVIAHLSGGVALTKFAAVPATTSTTAGYAFCLAHTDSGDHTGSGTLDASAMYDSVASPTLVTADGSDDVCTLP